MNKISEYFKMESGQEVLEFVDGLINHDIVLQLI